MPSGEQVGEQRDEPVGDDAFRRLVELFEGPPAGADDGLLLVVEALAQVDFVGVDAVEEELVAEDAFGPAEVGVAGGRGDPRSQYPGGCAEAGLLPALARRRPAERLEPVLPAAGGAPAGPVRVLAVRPLEQEQLVLRVHEEDAGGAPDVGA